MQKRLCEHLPRALDLNWGFREAFLEEKLMWTCDLNLAPCRRGGVVLEGMASLLRRPVVKVFNTWGVWGTEENPALWLWCSAGECRGWEKSGGVYWGLGNTMMGLAVMWVFQFEKNPKNLKTNPVDGHRKVLGGGGEWHEQKCTSVRVLC